MINKFILAIVLTAFAAGATYAWPACSGSWVGVPTGTTGTGASGTGYGAVVTESGQTFQCQAPSTTSGSSSISNSNASSSQSQNQGQQQTANGGSSKSTSSSSTGPVSVKTGGATASTGPVSAAGGAASVTNSGNSSATGGQGGAGGTGGTSSAVAGNSSSGSGNSTSVDETTNVAASKIPVNTAYAAAPYPTAQCFKGYGAGGQGASFGFSINGGKIDENCARLETARSFDAVGEYYAGCKVKVNNKYAKEAGVKLEDCLNRYVVPLPQVPQPAPVLPPIVINLPAPVVNVPVTPVIVDQVPLTPVPVFKTPAAKPHKKIKPPVGIKPCPATETAKPNGNCWEND